MADPRPAGSFLAARLAGADTAALLASGKSALEEVVVAESAWVAFMNAGLVDKWQALADGLLGPYEEAWFPVATLAPFREAASAVRASLATDAQRALDAAVALAGRAAERGV